MSCRGVHFALTDLETKTLLLCRGDEARVEHVQEEIEERFFEQDPQRLAETDKAWDAIHRVLTDGTLDCDEKLFPATHVILGGQQLHAGASYIMSLKSPAEVEAAAKVLNGATKDSLREAYNRLDPDDYEGDISEDDFEYTWQWFSALREFWKRASAERHHVLFTVDL